MCRAVRITGVLALIVIAKAPLVGFAKTRLAASLHPAFAARLADAFLRDTVRNCRRTCADQLWFSFTPASSDAYFRGLDATARSLPQGVGNLGVRLCAAFAAAFDAGARRVVLIGADTPHLRASTIDAAFACLEHSRGVLGPSVDGGYYLLGLRERCDELFEGITWSTASVAQETRARARGCGFELADLEEVFDVDLPADVSRLHAELALDADLAPHTASVLREWPAHGE